MPTVELDVKQLTAAVRQLHGDEFRRFLLELSRQNRKELADRGERELRAIVSAKLSARKQKRLSQLLSANGERVIGPAERDELESLVEETQRLALERSEAMYELYRRGIDVRPQVAVQRAKRK